MSHKVPLPDEEVARKYRQGATLRQLSLIYGCSIPRVRRSLMATGTPRRKQGTIGENLSRDEEIKMRHKIKGEPMRKLAKEYNISYQRIYQIVNNYIKPEQRQYFPDEKELFG